MSDKTQEVSELKIIAATKANNELGNVIGANGKRLLSGDHASGPDKDSGAIILNKYEESETNRDNSYKDHLTELLNRRGVKEESMRVLNILKREHDYKGFTVIVADMIGLKKLNEKLGGAGADGVIVESAKSMKLSAARATDLVSRWGGDEFVLVLFNQDPDKILGVIRKMLSTQPPVGRAEGRVGYNIGYSSFGPDAADVYTAIESCVSSLEAVKEKSPKDTTGRVTGSGVIVNLDE